MAKHSMKYQRGRSTPKCSLVTVFIVAWFIVMMSGGALMFREDIVQKFQQFEEFGGIKAIAKKSANSVGNVFPASAQQHQASNISNPFTTLKSDAEPKSSLRASRSNGGVFIKAITTPTPIVLKTLHPHPTAKSPPSSRNMQTRLSRKKITELMKFEKCSSPPPLLKGKDMWKMSLKDQRQYLQDIHCNETDPSPLPAEKFIAQAEASLQDTTAINTPSIWDVPLAMQEKIANSKPGDTVQYRIAGKDVQLPYGYPEESIFVLTASYRDPEVAYTIARAYAR